MEPQAGDTGTELKPGGEDSGVLWGRQKVGAALLEDDFARCGLPGAAQGPGAAWTAGGAPGQGQGGPRGVLQLLCWYAEGEHGRGPWVRGRLFLGTRVLPGAALEGPWEELQHT